MAASPSTTKKNPTIRTSTTTHDHHDHFSSRSAFDAQTTSPIPMSIRESNPKSPPPPLPPPRYIQGLGDAGADSGWHSVNRSNEGDSASAPVKSGSSLLGGQPRSGPKSYTGYKKNIDFGAPSIASINKDDQTLEGTDASQSDQRVPDLAALLEYNKLQGEKSMGTRFNERSSQAYDKQVLSRIGGPHTPPRSAGGHIIAGTNEELIGTPSTSFKHASDQLRPLSLPERRTSSEVDTPRWGSGPGSASALSPTLQALVSPMSDHLPDPKPTHKDNGSYSAQDGRSRSDRETYDQVMFGENEHTGDDPSVHDLNIHDKSPTMLEASRAGLKRRAESPPSETIDPNLRTGGNTDWQTRAQGTSERHPQAARLQETQPGSLSSTASAISSNGSYASSYAMSLASTATSYSSPGLFQHQEMKPPSLPLQQQPQPPQPGQMAQPPPPMHLQSNRAPPIPHRRQAISGMMRPPNVWICDCCPKKPKKFDSEDELRIHEMEKQYVCQYCHNRFKNKNEAERHQNSLHLRRHSWSCAALQSFEDAFHPSVNSTLATAAAAHAAATSTNPPSYPPPAVTDTCSYCGIEFPNPADWDVRIEHLNLVHKFGECNQSKKFFRADHFRQHLKHSHAGTSGRWTNMLENACMREEMPPQPIGHSMAQMPMGMPPPMHNVPQSPGMTAAMQVQAQSQHQPQSPVAPVIANMMSPTEPGSETPHDTRLGEVEKAEAESAPSAQSVQ